MKGRVIKKILVVLIVLIPVFFNVDCKKQAKCGCDGDVLFALSLEPATVIFNDTGSSIYFSTLSNPYDIYFFCNPGEMFPKLVDSKSGDILLVSGNVFWDCNYLMQSSNSQYGGYSQRQYQVMVTDVTTNLYGKK